MVRLKVEAQCPAGHHRVPRSRHVSARGVDKPGRPAAVSAELRALIQRMSLENPLWGALNMANCSSWVHGDAVNGGEWDGLAVLPPQRNAEGH